MNPAVVAALAEEGIDISAEVPKILTDEAVEASDYVITMGCGDACPFYPGKTYLDWALPDPAGQGVDAVQQALLRTAAEPDVREWHERRSLGLSGRILRPRPRQRRARRLGESRVV